MGLEISKLETKFQDVDTLFICYSTFSPIHGDGLDLNFLVTFFVVDHFQGLCISHF
jgi:hypothetical protein